jgi:hypothetical protein
MSPSPQSPHRCLLLRCLICGLLHSRRVICGFLVATVVSSVVELPPDPPGVIAHVAADELGHSTVTTRGVPPAVDLPLSGALIRLCSGTSSLDDTSSSLRTTHTTFPFSLLGARAEAAPPWPPAVPVPGLCTPRDWSPIWIGAMLMSSIEGIATSSNVLAAWPIQSG